MNLMMIEMLGKGGIAHYTFNLLGYLAKKDISVCLLTSANYEFLGKSHNYKVYPVMFRFANFIINFLPRLGDERSLYSFLRRLIKLIEYPFNILKALAICKKGNIKYAHIQSVNWIEIIMIFMFKLAGLKIIYTIHNVDPHHKKLRNYHKIIYRIMYGYCDCIIIHSDKGKEEIDTLFQVRSEKVFVIPHGDYKFFVPEIKYSKEQAKEKLSISKKYRTILFFGAIRENKGLDLALQALPHVKQFISNVKLMIVGEPWENYKKYRNIININNLDGNIYEHLGYVSNDDLPLFFFASDIVVLPYREITQSGILQIAYAFSKPVIATALDGFKETVEDGKNGYLVPIGDHKYFGQKIVELLSCEQKMKEMGEYSRYLSDTKYSWESIAGRTLDVYSKLGELSC